MDKLLAFPRLGFSFPLRRLSRRRKLLSEVSMCGFETGQLLLLLCEPSMKIFA